MTPAGPKITPSETTTVAYVMANSVSGSTKTDKHLLKF